MGIYVTVWHFLHLRFSNPNNMKRCHDVIIMFSESVYKTCQRQLTESKLGKLLVHSKFHKICKFENHVTRNYIMMTSLPETMEKCRPPPNQTSYTSLERC